MVICSAAAAAGAADGGAGAAVIGQPATTDSLWVI
jgi:hypothetical protein